MSNNRIHATMHFLSMGIVIVSLLILVLYILLSHEKELLVRVWLIYIIISLPMVALSGREYEHYGLILVPLCILPITIILRILDEKVDNKGYVLIVLGVTVALLTYPYIHHNNLLTYTATTDDSLDGLVASFIKENTEPDDMIIVSGTRDVIYFLSERMSASKYSYQSPIGEMDSTIYDKTMEDVERNKPVFLVLHMYDANGEIFVEEMNQRLTVYAETNGYSKEIVIDDFVIYWKKE